MQTTTPPSANTADTAAAAATTPAASKTARRSVRAKPTVLTRQVDTSAVGSAASSHLTARQQHKAALQHIPGLTSPRVTQAKLRTLAKLQTRQRALQAQMEQLALEEQLVACELDEIVQHDGRIVAAYLPAIG